MFATAYRGCARQPQYPAPLNRANPLTKDIAFAWHAGAPEIVRENTPRNFADGPHVPKFATTINLKSGAGPRGRAVVGTAGTKTIEWANYQPLTSSNLSTFDGDTTIAVLAAPDSDSALYGYLVGQNNNTNPAPYIQCEILANSQLAVATAGWIDWLTYDAVGNGVDLSVAGKCDGKWHLWVGVNWGTLHYLYQDGVQIGYQEHMAQRHIQNEEQYLAVGGQGNSTTGAAAIPIAWAAGWNRMLTPAEVISLSENPYQIFVGR